MHALCKVGGILGIGKHYCGEHMELTNLKQRFHRHVEMNGLLIGTKEEHKFRMNLFKKNDDIINKFNKEHHSSKLGHNFMSHMTKREMKKYMGTKIIPEHERHYVLMDDHNIKSAVDWRTKGYVNPIKNQGHCGSCWAFGATASVEAAHKHASGKLLNLSEQEVVSCDHGSHGCQGGWQSSAFKYLESHKQELTSDYPYTSGTSGKTGACKYVQTKGKVGVRSYANVRSNSVAQLKAAIDKTVVTVTVEADHPVFHMYKKGIIDSKECGTHLDHAIAAVGYGSEGGKEYYIVRNSWGTGWGESGYVRIAAVEGQGICGIQMQSLFATTD